MSSSHLPPDCALQLPSWDEFDPTEELDYNESDLENDEHSSSSPKNQQSTSVGPTLPRGFDIGTSTSPSSSRILSADEREQRSSVPPDVKHPTKVINGSGDENNANDNSSSNRNNDGNTNNNGKQVSSTSFFDQLPNSPPQHFDKYDQPCSSQTSSSRPLGPALLNDDHNEEDDPEDPGDPEDPDENDSRWKVPNLCTSEGRMSESVNRPSSSGTSSSTRIGPIGPAVPPGLGDCSPSLPDDEIRPRLQGHFSYTTMPPPEPRETRGLPSWSSSSRLVDSSNARSDSRTSIEPVMPYLLPAVSHHQHGEANEEEGEEEEAYGPTVPPDLNPSLSSSAPQQQASTSNSHNTDNLEMPIEDDEHCGVVRVSEVDDDDDNDIVGPIPPCESAEAVQKEYKHRLSTYETEQINKSSTSKGEDWMVKLPKKLNCFGLSARTFSKSTGKGSLTDRDGAREWTETPQEKATRLLNAPSSSSTSTSDSLRSASVAERDLVQQQRASNLNRDRNASMLEMHRRKRKADDGCSDLNEQSTSRHPFDRERDVQVKGIGNAGVEEIKERCGKLSSRFGHSSTQNFL